MAGEFLAGAVLVELKAQVTNLKKNVSAAKVDMASFGKSTEAAAKKVNQGGQKIADTFSGLDNASAKMAARFTRFSALLLASQAAMSEFGDTGEKSLSGLNVAVEAGARGLAAFTIIVSSFPTKVGVGLGAIAALVTAFGAARKAISEVEEKMASLNKRLEENRKKVIASVAAGAAKAFTEPGAQGLLSTKIDEIENQIEKTFQFRAQLEDAQTQRDNQRLTLDKELAEAKARLNSLQAQAAEGSRVSGGALQLNAFEIQQAAEAVDDVSKKIGRLESAVISAGNAVENGGVNLDEAKAKLERFRTALDLSKGVEDARKLEEAIKDVANAANFEQNENLIGPMEALTRVSGASRGALNAYILAQQQLLRAADEIRGLDDEAASALQARAEELNTTIGVLISKVKSSESFQASEGRRLDLSKNLAASISLGLEEGILSAQQPMEALANIGEGLFKNMMDEATKRLEGGLTDLFQSVSGIGGEGVGLALSGLLGVGGAVLSRLGSKSESSFGNVKSAISSTEATRGIIAGPANIAIAAVGENLARVMVPVTDRLDISNQLLLVIERNTRGGGSPGGGSPAPVVRVPTDLA